MSDYSVTVNFGAKDALASGNPSKVVLGSELTTEFTNIATAIATKPDEPATAGTVEASKAVVVDSNKDALGFRKITGSTSTGYTAHFTYTGTTNSDYAVYGQVTGATGETVAIRGANASETGRGVRGVATHATGINYGGNFESNSSAGYGVYAATTVAGGIPIYAAAADAADAYPSAKITKGNRYIQVNPRSSAGAGNPIAQTADQVIMAAGAGGAVDTGVLTLAPYATDAVGIRIDSTVDTVVISGATTIGTATITTANITSCLATNLQGYTEIGAIAFLAGDDGQDFVQNTSYAASVLNYCTLAVDAGVASFARTAVASGTWLCLGATSTIATGAQATLFVRVS